MYFEQDILQIVMKFREQEGTNAAGRNAIAKMGL